MTHNAAVYEYTPDLSANIIKAAEVAYHEVAITKDVAILSVPRMRECRDLSVLLGLELAAEGIVYGVDSRNGITCDEHKYLTIATNLGELVIDPSWKQFAPIGPINPVYPDTAIRSREDMEIMAAKAGISFEDRQLWSPKGTYEEPDNRPIQERIASAIDIVA